jgi:sarcosine oxidase subunit alpha
MSSHRLPDGGLIDRSSRADFTFDGRHLSGFAGDTLASALLANGRQLVGRSFKYHRPRGILTAGAAEPNALVTIGTGGRREANVRATVAELYDGMVSASQNRWPSLGFDVGAVNQLFSPFLAAGFYYKTFMWPAALWEKLYEPLIRRAAGLGKAAYERDPDRYEKRWAHCDLLVVGAGPAGLMAALAAARTGARVILVDEQALPGGSLLNERETVGGVEAAMWARQVATELDSLPNVRVLLRTTAFGWYDSNVFGALERVQKHRAQIDPARPVERLWRIAAKRAVLASGAEERPLVYGGNDRPGVMIAGATRAYLNRYAVAPGRKVAIFTNGDNAYRTARDLQAQGIEVAAVIDSRSEALAAASPARTVHGGVVTRTFGGHGLKGIEVATPSGYERIAVDALAVSGGYTPVINLACQRGARPIWDEKVQAFLAPETEGLAVAGSAAGIYGLAACLRDGSEKAAAAVGDLGYKPIRFDLPETSDEAGTGFSALWHVKKSRGKAFVDFQNDVTVSDLGLAVREGYGHIEHAKRYTTTGMATDQGKLSNLNAIGIVAEARGKSPAEIGTTTFRPFYTPVSFGAVSGAHRERHFQPARQSPLHGWAVANGAVFVESGLWHRSAWFPREGETHWRESVDREAANVRANVGICDVSTLGKIEIFGSDAAEFLNRVYCNGFAKLPVGKARYGLMLREDGFIYDDGTTSRLAEDHYFMTTTTAQAAGVLNHLEFCAQVLWPELDVRFASVSDQWAQMAIAGPKARAVVAQLVDRDISNAAFPYLAAADVTVMGSLPARLFRISFSGELAYELSVPARAGKRVADAVMQAGAEHGIMPYGIEALSVLRIEKGHVTHAEINGTVVPDDIGMGRMASRSKNYVGRPMLEREAMTAQERLQLVGLKPTDGNRRIRTGSHLLGRGAAPSTENDQGHVTSACYSPALGYHIALALVKRGRARHGEEIKIWDGLHGDEFSAVICDPAFFDPQNEKLHV